MSGIHNNMEAAYENPDGDPHLVDHEVDLNADPDARDRPNQEGDMPTRFQRFLSAVTWPRVKWIVISGVAVGAVCVVVYKLHTLKSSIEALRSTVETGNTQNKTLLMAIIRRQRLDHLMVSGFSNRLLNHGNLERQLKRISALIEQNTKSFEQLSLEMKTKLELPNPTTVINNIIDKSR